MSSEISNHFEQMVKYKAKRMKNREGYESYRKSLLTELNITKLDEAFLLGAYDAMIYDMAGAIGQAFMKPAFRKAILRKIIADS